MVGVSVSVCSLRLNRHGGRRPLGRRDRRRRLGHGRRAAVDRRRVDRRRGTRDHRLRVARVGVVDQHRRQASEDEHQGGGEYPRPRRGRAGPAAGIVPVGWTVGRRLLVSRGAPDRAGAPAGAESTSADRTPRRSIPGYTSSGWRLPRSAFGGRAGDAVIAHRTCRVRRRRLEALAGMPSATSLTVSAIQSRSISVAWHRHLLVVEHVVVGLRARPPASTPRARRRRRATAGRPRAAAAAIAAARSCSRSARSRRRAGGRRGPRGRAACARPMRNWKPFSNQTGSPASLVQALEVAPQRRLGLRVQLPLLLARRRSRRAASRRRAARAARRAVPAAAWW